MSRNPFVPTFGAAPPLMAGREAILSDIADAFSTGPTHPSYTSLFLGCRGSGKTVILGALRDLAHERGWLSISSAAVASGLLNRIAHRCVEHLNRCSDRLPDKVMADLNAAGIGVGAHYDPQSDLSRRIDNVFAALGALATADGTGLLITVDELHAGDIDELKLLGIAVQEVVRVGRHPVAFAGAGLTLLEDSLLADTSVTFLQRCARYDVGFLDPTAAWEAIAQPVRELGTRMSPQAVDRAVTVSQGYPFMVQLVGFHAWVAANDPESEITEEDVNVGAEIAARQIGQLVVAPIWKDLSPTAKRFAIAMAQDEGESRIADIAARLGVSSGYASVYRHRLLRTGLISTAGHGKIDFALETTRDWIRTLDEYRLIE